MVTPSKTKSCFEQILPESYAKRFHENIQRVSIDCLKPRSNKNKFFFECKKCGEFYALNYQNS